MVRPLRPLFLGIICACAIWWVSGVTWLAFAQAASDTPAATPSGTGLPIPRYVSLKSDKVYLRQGPGFDHRVLWVFRRAGLPVEVIREFETWRQVRDAEGTTGWVSHTLVSGRRTALVLPWDAKTSPTPQTPLLSNDSERAPHVAIIEAGVIANIRSCDGTWCYVSIGELRGYIAQKKLWGVYPNETLR